MNLVIDIGNSSIKSAVYDKQICIFISRDEEFNIQGLINKTGVRKIDKAIVSSVRELPAGLIRELSENIQFIHILSYKTSLPFSIEYQTPETLGSDRIAAVSGAFNKFPGKQIMVIDAGTAITYDFLSGTVYKGGNISPGLITRFRALNHFTGKLPLLSPDHNFTSPGRNTRDAILAGVINGLTYEINEYIRTFKNSNDSGLVIITGGDSEFLKGKINYEVMHMPDIVIDGLNYILNYNAK